jgi:glycosyltransferase involved in cell wall biosynthesis
MAAKRPVVATQVGAVPDVIEDGRTGVLVPPRDPHRLAQVVIGLLRDPGRQRALYSQDYVSRLVTDMRELYLRLVRQRGIVFKPEEP